jgi:outer membrane murein-binding lipoprotein Lpp
MAIDNQFRIDELISKGSRAIVSKDEVTGNHTFVQGSKEVINDPYPHLKGERDGEQVGRIEKPKYNEDQLTKAVDTVVDELIGPAKKPQPDVVPRELYDDLRRLYNESLSRINELERQVSDLQAQVEQLLSQIEALQIELDAARIQQAVAENQAQQTNEQYIALLQDFSQAVIKSTKEGIERVSLKGQVEGLIAQKESLREQLKATLAIVGQLESQLKGAAAESSAAAAGLVPGQDNEFFYGVTQEGKTDPAWDASDIGFTTARKNPKKSGKVGTLDIQNLRDDEAKITKLEISTVGTTPENKRILGFTDGSSPSLSKSVDIEVGAKEKVDLYFNTGLSSLDRNTYSGSWKLTVTYSDGSKSQSNNLSWGLRVNSG